MRRLSSLAVLTVGLVVVAGCSSGPKLVPVKGRVTLDGKPVRDMLINFQPVVGKAAGEGAHAMTDPDGRFTLLDVRGGTGAHVGEYKVSFYPSLGRKPEGDPNDVVNDGSKSG